VDQVAYRLQARPPTDSDISDSVHPPDTQYFTLAPHIKGVKAMQICQIHDPGFCSEQQDLKDQHPEKSDLGGDMCLPQWDLKLTK